MIKSLSNACASAVLSVLSVFFLLAGDNQSRKKAESLRDGLT